MVWKSRRQRNRDRAYGLKDDEELVVRHFEVDIQETQKSQSVQGKQLDIISETYDKGGK
jgi:hypothetical protein